MHPSAPGWADTDEISQLPTPHGQAVPMAYHDERGIGSGEATIWIRQTVMFPGQHHGPFHPTGNEILDPIPAEGFPGMVTGCPRIHTYGFWKAKPWRSPILMMQYSVPSASSPLCLKPEWSSTLRKHPQSSRVGLEPPLTGRRKPLSGFHRHSSIKTMDKGAMRVLAVEITCTQG